MNSNQLKRNIMRLGYYSFAGLGAAYFTQIYFQLNKQSPSASLASLLEGTALLPFQYRVLVPWTVKAAYVITSPWTTALNPERLFKLVVFAFLLVLLFGFERYLRLIVTDEATSQWMALSLFYVLPFNYIFPRYFPDIHPADIPSVALFTLGLSTLYKRNWKFYYIIFALATLNRETSCFLTIVYLLTAYRKDNLKTLAAHTTTQLLIWVAIKAALYWLYHGNGNAGMFEIHFLDNLRTLMHSGQLLTLLSNLGFIWLPTILLYRHIHDDFVRRALWVSIPYMFGMFIVGVIVEIRIFGELIPIFLPAVLIIVKEALSGSNPNLFLQEGK